MSDDTGSNPLESLFVDQQPLDLELLAKTIRPYIQLLRDPPKVDFTWDWEQLTLDKKLLTYFLGRKALQATFSGVDEIEYLEKVQPNIIEEDTGIPGGSVRPTLKRLREKKYIKNVDGYFIPNNALPQLSEYILGEEE